MKRLSNKMRIFLLALAALLALSSCGSSGGMYETATVESDSPRSDRDYGYDSYLSEDADYGDYAAEDGYSLPISTPGDDDGTHLIYQVEMELQTNAFEEGNQILLDEVASAGGTVRGYYLRGRDVRDEFTERFSEYQVQIPTDGLSDFIATMESHFNRLWLRMNTQDITREYDKVDNRFSDLEQELAQLEEMLEILEDPDDIAAVESQINEIQRRIRALEPDRSAMERSVAMSTVTIRLYEVIGDDYEIEDDSFGARLSQTTNSSLSGFVSFWQGALLFLITILPGLVIILFFAAVIVFVYRWMKKKNLIKPRESKPRPTIPTNTGYPMAPPPPPPSSGNQKPPEDYR